MTPAGTSTHQTSRINGMTTHTHYIILLYVLSSFAKQPTILRRFSVAPFLESSHCVLTLVKVKVNGGGRGGVHLQQITCVNDSWIDAPTEAVLLKKRISEGRN